MKRRSFLFAGTPRAGVALIVTLCFLVLISALVLGFFARAQLQRQISFSSVSQKTADTLALSAADIVVSELRSEMASTNTSKIFQADGTQASDASTTNLPLVYQPLTNSVAIPEKRGDPNTAWINLIKRSYPTAADASTSLAFYTGGRPIIAASASADTTTNSLDGRTMDDTLWRMPRLVAGGTPALSARWCVITRRGPESVSDADIAQLSDPAGPRYAIGRFAFMVYDVGGLLDINVAGNALPSTNNATRSFINQADLSQIPGISAAALLNWRNPLTQSDTNYLFSGTVSGRSPRFGEQVFANRQDLIRYATANPAVISTNALPSLTIFSREWNAPSWYPSKNANDAALGGSSSYAYRDNQNASNALNRFVPNVRIAATSTGTMTGYHIDGTSYFYSVKIGEPLIQRRFPLGRLNWLGRNGPQNGGTAQNIQACFGLAWDPSNKIWKYVGPIGGTVLTSIASLATVASQNREANFFELLQAGILQGSLGLNSSAASTGTELTYDVGMSSTANQVIQIGANLIDQYDADSYPTRISFNANEFYGSESLPLISKMLLGAYRPVDKTADPANGLPDRWLLKTWFEFEVWNPYQGSATDQPTRFRIRQTDGVGWVKITPKKLNTSDPATITQETAGTHATAGNALTVSATSMSSVASDPKILDTLRREGATVSSSNPSDDLYLNEDGSAASYVGLFAGDSVLSQPDYPDSNIPLSNIRFYFSPSSRYVMEYDYGSDDWRTVQKLAYFSPGGDAQNFAIAIPQSIASVPEQAKQPNRRWGAYLSLDPRTTRFGFNATCYGRSVGDGVSTTSVAPFWDRTPFWSLSDTKQQFLMVENPSGSTFQPSMPANTLVTKYWNSGFRYADNGGTGAIAMSNIAGSNPGTQDPIYKDPDGVQRVGDAVWNTANGGAQGVFPTLSATDAAHGKDRPIILNRPFLSVGEMGYAFRDLPFKSLDFSSAKSADAALLDLFSVGEGDPSDGLVAGRVDLNTRHPEVLSALLVGTTRTSLTPASNQLSAADAASIAQSLVTLTSGTGTGQSPLLNVADLATRFSDPVTPNQVKGQKEAALRSLAGLGQTRTWNLMIDIIAQVGRYPAGGGAKKLSDFTVEGERRYWLHLAIDRYTGEILDRQIEPVSN